MLTVLAEFTVQPDDAGVTSEYDSTDMPVTRTLPRRHFSRGTPLRRLPLLSH